MPKDGQIQISVTKSPYCEFDLPIYRKYKVLETTFFRNFSSELADFFDRDLPDPYTETKDMWVNVDQFGNSGRDWISLLGTDAVKPQAKIPANTVLYKDDPTAGSVLVKSMYRLVRGRVAIQRGRDSYAIGATSEFPEYLGHTALILGVCFWLKTSLFFRFLKPV